MYIHSKLGLIINFGHSREGVKPKLDTSATNSKA